MTDSKHDDVEEFLEELGEASNEEAEIQELLDAEVEKIRQGIQDGLAQGATMESFIRVNLAQQDQLKKAEEWLRTLDDKGQGDYKVMREILRDSVSTLARAALVE